MQASKGDFPHLMFYGPAGAGKKTRIMALLREVYGPGVDKLKVGTREFKLGPSNATKVELTLISSNYHIEFNPSDAGNSDKGVLQEVVSGLAESRSLVGTSGSLGLGGRGGSGGGGASSSSAGGGGGRVVPGFKVVIINEVDKLSRQAQNALRRTMETATASCRLILCGNSTTKIIEPLRSRCLCVRVGAPSIEETVAVLDAVATAEGLVLPPSLARKIATKASRNMRRAILALEACKVAHYPFADDQDVA